MFAARNISRVARITPRQATIVSRATMVSRAMPTAIISRATPITIVSRAMPAAHRALTISYPVFKANTVNETEVPATVFSAEGKAPGGMHVTIPVKPEDRAGPAVPETNEMENLTTLSDESFDKLPATVKSMTVKGKVIIVTG